MKKFIMLALVLTTIAVSAFANMSDAINQKVLNSFNRSFASAQDVHWELKQGLYKVTFKTAGQEMFAYYNGDGEQVALSRNIRVDQLPLALATELKGGYNTYWLTDLFEVSSNGETTYYATVESSTHITMLKAEGMNGWTTFKKEKRK
jgi:hypothetical protein